MKNVLFILLCIAGITACAPTQKSEARKINVLGYGTVKTYPDYAEINLNVSFTKDRMKDAVKEVQEVTAHVVDVCDSFVKSRKDDIHISNITTDKSYEWIRDRSVFVGYNASTSIVVKIVDLSLLEEIMEKLLATRINSISSINYSHSMSDSLRREANVIALKDASGTADKICKEMGVKRGKIFELSNYKATSGYGRGSDDMYQVQNMELGLYGKGFGGSGFKFSPEMLHYNSICSMTVEIE
jgi:uncharacterized protein